MTFKKIIIIKKTYLSYAHKRLTLDYSQNKIGDDFIKKKKE
jgi:hypothetical protein